MRWRTVAVRWFVQYNPLYFASALCVLGGVFLIAKENPADDFSSKLGIAASTEAYQGLLLLGAWLLLRAGQFRPATILGLAALVFLMDASLNGERIFSHARTLSFAPGMRARKAVPASAALAVLGTLKLWALARVFRLRDAKALLLPAGAVVAALPILPYVLELAGPWDESRRGAHLALFWLGAPLFGWGFTRAARGWTSSWAPDVVDERTRRIASVAPFTVVGFFILHGAAWSTFPGLGLSPAHAAPYLLVGACSVATRLASRGSKGAEPVAWAGTASALVVSWVSPLSISRWPMAAVALMTGASFFFLAYRARLRLLLPATVCAFGGAYAFAAGAVAPLPVPGPLWPGALAIALLGGAMGHRDFRCLVASAVSAGTAVPAIEPAASLTSLGILLGGVWLATWAWLVFPELRRWVPFAAAVGVLGFGAVALVDGTPGLACWYGATAATAVGVGAATHRREFLVAGLAAAGPLGLSMRAAWLPRTGGGWGVMLVIAGFVFLSAGVSFNLLVAARRAQGREAGGEAP